MTACFKLMRALQPQKQHSPSISLCGPCVYFGRNLDPTKFELTDGCNDGCGLGFVPGDEECREMRTNNCSTRKNKS